MTTTLERRLKEYTEEVLEMFEQVGLADKLPDSFTVRLNPKLSRAIGKCKLREEGYIIEFASRYFEGYVEHNMHDKILNTLVHEFCHALPNGMNHGTQWKRYADRFNNKYNLGITRLAESDQVVASITKSLENNKIKITCNDCNEVFYVTPRHGVCNNIEFYKCTCGGSLRK